MNLHSLDAYAWNHNRRAGAATHRSPTSRPTTRTVWARLSQALAALLALVKVS